MATSTKKVEAKKEEVKVAPKKTLQQKMDEITFRNADANKLKAAQDEKTRLKLKEQMGRKKLERAATPYAGVKGLQGLQGLQGLGKNK
jgi:hypothetical protein